MIISQFQIHIKFVASYVLEGVSYCDQKAIYNLKYRLHLFEFTLGGVSYCDLKALFEFETQVTNRFLIYDIYLVKVVK